MVTDLNVAGNAMKTEVTMTYVLKEVTKEDCLVEMLTEMAFVPPQKSDLRIPLKLVEGKAADQPPPRSGIEEILVAGRKLTCKWTEIETESGGVKTVVRVYTHESVPGGTVKYVAKSPTMTSTMEVLEFGSK